MFKTGTLWKSITAQTARALETGALLPIATSSKILHEGGIPFVVRQVENISRKEADAKTGHLPGGPDPFIDYEKDLFVTDISVKHRCLLNKYNVVENHILIVTTLFEPQETLLRIDDFLALWLCLKEFKGLGFYNGGKLSGASQGHKHLQIVPLPLSPLSKERGIPIGKAVEKALLPGSSGKIGAFSFSHGVAPTGCDNSMKAEEAALRLYRVYRELLDTTGIERISENEAGAYNLLITKEWMVMVKRREESCRSIGVNSLGFAGALLVKNEQQMNLLVNMGPLAVLEAVSEKEQPAREQ